MQKITRISRTCEATGSDSPMPVPAATYAAKQTGHLGISASRVPGTSQPAMARARRNSDGGLPPAPMLFCAESTRDSSASEPDWQHGQRLTGDSIRPRPCPGSEEKPRPKPGPFAIIHFLVISIDIILYSLPLLGSSPYISSVFLPGPVVFSICRNTADFFVRGQM